MLTRVDIIFLDNFIFWFHCSTLFFFWKRLALWFSLISFLSDYLGLITQTTSFVGKTRLACPLITHITCLSSYLKLTLAIFFITFYPILYFQGFFVSSYCDLIFHRENLSINYHCLFFYCLIKIELIN